MTTKQLIEKAKELHALESEAVNNGDTKKFDEIHSKLNQVFEAIKANHEARK